VIPPGGLARYVLFLLCPVCLVLGAAFYLAGWWGLAASIAAYLIAGVAVRSFLVDLGGKVVFLTRGNHAASGIDVARHLEGSATTPELARSMNHARRLLSLFVVCLWPLYVIVWRSASRS